MHTNLLQKLFNAVHSKSGTPDNPAQHNRVMFAPNALSRTEGLPVDNTLAQVLRVYHQNPNDQTHALFHRTASISEIEPRIYQHFTDNPNSIANWLVPLVQAHAKLDQPLLRIPRTQVMRLDQPLAQFTRMEYHDTNEVSKRTFNAYLEDTLDLPDDAFIKTGTFSGKFQFANCHCKEPDEMGEYFQAITNYAQMVGAGESADIAVRDYITDHDPHRPTIYGGMPLRCEYRFFVDFGAVSDATVAEFRTNHTEPLTDTAIKHTFGLNNTDNTALPDPRVLGVTHYWHPRVMRAHQDRLIMDEDYARFAAVADSAGLYNEASIFSSFEPQLRRDFDAHVEPVTAALEALLPHMQAAGFRGAWSIDIMCNTESDGSMSYYLIDMALACESALIDELYTVDEMRMVNLDEIMAATSGEMLIYPPAQKFVPGTYTDGHGVAHTLHLADTAQALRVGVERSIIPNDGSAVPIITKIDKTGQHSIISAPTPNNHACLELNADTSTKE